MKTYLLTAVAMTIVLTMAPITWAGGIEAFSTDLPPDGEYVSPDEYHSYSALGIVLDDPSHLPLVGQVDRVSAGDDEIETFDSVFTAIEIGLGLGPIELTGPVQTIVHERRLSTTGTFDTEIVSMSLTGSTSIGPIMVREDPARASSGQTTIEDLGGGLYHIDSFFDVFTELSVDGGDSWVPCDAGTRMTLNPDPPVPTGIESPSTDLPPDGEYTSPDEFHSYAALGIILDDPRHLPILDMVERVSAGNDEIETFDSVFTAIEIGLGLGTIELTGPVQVVVSDRLSSATGTFDTEIVSMSLTGSTSDGPIMIREDPNRASTGQTTITDIGGGLYHIDSFFDVFTELSVDGGKTWVPCDAGTRMVLHPAPPEPTGIESLSTDLPPDGEYIAPDEYHSYAAVGIILDDPSHRPIVEGVERVAAGDDEIETFDSVFTAIEIGLGLGPIELTGPVQTVVSDRRLSTTGMFDTEIVSMSLSGSTSIGPIMVREDPARASTGQTTISDLGGGLYHIDSFFDVFTELSVDGGDSWVASDAGTRMVLFPPPPKPGDADGDGDVDLDDFAALKNNFGTTAGATVAEGDFDGDGDVDLDDFAILKNNFGT